MNIQWKKLIPCLLFPLAVGGLAGFLTRSSMSLFDAVQKPPLSPPGWLFPVVWTILYLLMGFASYLVLVSERPGQTAWKLYVIQLILTFSGRFSFSTWNSTWCLSYGFSFYGC